MSVLVRTSAGSPLVRQPSTFLASQTFRDISAKPGLRSTTLEPSRDLRQALLLPSHSHSLQELPSFIYMFPEKEDRHEPHRLCPSKESGASKSSLEVY